MILQIRTRNDLKEILKLQKSAAWRVSEKKLELIQKVEVYNFEGNQMVAGDFDLEKTEKREKDGRYIIAFKNAELKTDVNMKWIGQNPIKYVSADGVEGEETTDNSIPEKVFIIEFETSDHDVITKDNLRSYCDYCHEKVNIINSFFNKHKNSKVFYIDNSPDKSFKFMKVDDFSLSDYLYKDLIEDLGMDHCNIQIAAIFKPDDSLWEREFLDLSEEVDKEIRIYGYMKKYSDIVYQNYDIGELDTGIIVDAEEENYYFSSDLARSPFPDKELFNINNYITVQQAKKKKEKHKTNDIQNQEEKWKFASEDDINKASKTIINIVDKIIKESEKDIKEGHYTIYIHDKSWGIIEIDLDGVETFDDRSVDYLVHYLLKRQGLYHLFLTKTQMKDMEEFYSNQPYSVYSTPPPQDDEDYSLWNESRDCYEWVILYTKQFIAKTLINKYNQEHLKEVFGDLYLEDDE